MEPEFGFCHLAIEFEFDQYGGYHYSLRMKAINSIFHKGCKFLGERHLPNLQKLMECKNLKQMLFFWQCSKPVIAAIHSACVGGGVDMTSACDIRYCTGDAWFQIKVMTSNLY